MFPPEIEREREAMYRARAAGNEGRARVLPGGRPAFDEDPLADAEFILCHCLGAAGPLTRE
jgi:hypothetical protein